MLTEKTTEKKRALEQTGSDPLDTPAYKKMKVTQSAGDCSEITELSATENLDTLVIMIAI